MEKELKELLQNLPSEEYLDKLVKACELWSQIKNVIPDKDYLERLGRLPDFDDLPDEAYLRRLERLPQLEDLPDEDYLERLERLPDIDDLPNEAYLDKIIKAGKISFEN